MKALCLQLKVAIYAIFTLKVEFCNLLFANSFHINAILKNEAWLRSKKTCSNFVIFLIFFSVNLTQSIAQPTHPCYSEDKQPNCTANEFTVQSVFLAIDENGTPLSQSACDNVSSVLTYLCVKVKNESNSDREGFYIAGEFTTGNSIHTLDYCFEETMISYTEITLCTPYPSAFVWNCSNNIELTGSLAIWPTASGELCPGNVMDCDVTNKAKCKKESAIIVDMNPLNAEFEGECDQNNELQVNFTNTTAGGTLPYIDFAWDFGDCEGTSNEENPSYTYASEGIYYVQLIVTDSNENKDTTIQLLDLSNCSISNDFPIDFECNPNITVNLEPCVCEDVVEFRDPIIPDFCGDLNDITINRTDNSGLNSGDIFPAGTTTISYEAIDIFGNTANCSFNIILKSSDPGSLFCNGDQNISLDENCQAEISPDMVVKSPKCDIETYVITLFDEFGNELPDNIIPSEFLGKVVTARATYGCFNTYCEVFLTIEDKMPPTFDCTDMTVSCGEAINFQLPEIKDNCDNASIVLLNEVITDVSCENEFIDKIVTRTYGIKNGFGMQIGSCDQKLNVMKFDIEDVDAPEQNVSVYCGLDYPTDENGHPDPALTGAPSLDGVDLWPQQDILCNVALSYTDRVLPSSPCSKQIIREWTVLNWYCGSDGMENYIQKITLIDTVPPMISCPSNVTISSASMSCETTYSIPTIQGQDACQSEIFVDIAYPGGFAQNSNGLDVELPLGENEITYRVRDICGKQSSCSFIVTVNDNVQPVAICESGLSFSLGGDGLAILKATTFDNGSLDECGLATVEIAKMTDNCGIEGNTEFGSEIILCCEDVGKEVMVILKVTDESGNSSQCMSSITVIDLAIPVVLTDLPDITVSNDLQIDTANLSVFGFVEINTDEPEPIVIDAISVNFSSSAQNGVVLDNCDNAIVFETQTSSFDMCGLGTIYRNFEITDAYGNSTTIDQKITVVLAIPFTEENITWPDDITLNNVCSPDLDPISLNSIPLYDESFNYRVSYTNEDDTLSASNNGCFVVERKWFVSDWCNRVNGASFIVFKDTQLIHIVNNISPVIISSCQDSVICSYISNCGPHPILLSAEAMDDCTSEENLIWTVQVDFGDDATIDFEGYSNQIALDLPVGLNKITWIVDDGCGNITRCSYHIEVESCLNPQPFCLTGQEFYINPIDTSGDEIADIEGVRLTTDMIDGGSKHPCGKEISLSFSADVNDTVKIFECLNIGSNPVMLWATDSDGRSDFCNVFVTILDTSSMAFCQGVNINGIIFGNQVDFVKEVNVELFGADALSTTDENGFFSFPSMPLGGSYNIVPKKTDEAINGVTTSDLVLIQRHILNIDPFESPYKLIAADVNQSQSVTAADLISIRKLLLGRINNFDNNKTWAFIPGDFIFIDPDDPWASEVPEIYEIPILENNMEVDFIGVKLGDVNESIDLNSIYNASRSVESLIYTRDKEHKNKVNIIVDEEMKIANMLLELEFDSNQYLLLGAENKIINMEFDYYQLNPNTVRILLSDYQNRKIEKGEILFSLEFKDEVKFEDFKSFNLNSKVSEIAYEDGSSSEIKLRFQSSENQIQIFQNSPNPWIEYTNFEVYVPDYDLARFKITDVSGKQIISKNLELKAGYNTVKILKNELPSNGGLFFYEISGKFGHQTMKMMLLNH